MKHSRSSAEVLIRDAVVARFRELWPDARIIHEMNVEHGSSRADVVAVQPDRVWICEIKSERDKLDRLAGQIADFGPTCHGLVVAAHEKWTRRERIEVPARVNRAGRHVRGYMTMKPSPIMIATANCKRFTTWEYPTTATWWQPGAVVPWFHRMLLLLWTDELRDVAAEHLIPCTRTTPGYKLVPQLARMLTGSQIEQAVCARLRARTFAEADAAICSPVKPSFPTPRQEILL